ncbi:unnamed protein product, partial [Rotaria sp. Silwood1]
MINYASSTTTIGSSTCALIWNLLTLLTLGVLI